MTSTPTPRHSDGPPAEAIQHTARTAHLVLDSEPSAPPQPQGWCQRCGHPYLSCSEPTCECAGDPPVAPDARGPYDARVRALYARERDRIAAPAIAVPTPTADPDGAAELAELAGVLGDLVRAAALDRAPLDRRGTACPVPLLDRIRAALTAARVRITALRDERDSALAAHREAERAARRAHAVGAFVGYIVHDPTRHMEFDRDGEALFDTISFTLHPDTDTAAAELGCAREEYPHAAVYALVAAEPTTAQAGDHVSSVRHPPARTARIGQALAERLGLADLDEPFTAPSALRGRMGGDCTPARVNSIFALLRGLTGLRIVCVWEFRDTVGFGGHHDLYLEDVPGEAFYHLDGDLWAWLSASVTDPTPPEPPVSPPTGWVPWPPPSRAPI